MNKELIKKNSMLLTMIGFSLIVYIIGLIFINSKLSWTTGIVFGLAFAVLKLKLMENTLNKAVKMPQDKAQRYANGQYMLRYLMTGVVLVIAAMQSYIILLGVVVGLVSTKIGAYMQLAINRQEQSFKSGK